VQDNDETICTGNVTEMKTIGGECAFIAGMILDSLILRESVLWYSAMVGKKSSLTTLKQMLLQEGVPREQIFIREFAQGVTYRWGLAWTFSPEAAALNKAFEMVRPQTQHQPVSSKGVTVRTRYLCIHWLVNLSCCCSHSVVLGWYF
jgi:23S rRNA A1618 N6-methylase RlmF